MKNYDEIAGMMRAVRAAILEEQESGRRTREQSITLTQLETAILWRERDVFASQKPTNESNK